MHKDSIAINFRGMLRTWDKCKFSILDAFSIIERQYNIVYFMDTWEQQIFTSYFHDVENREIVEVENQIVLTKDIESKLHQDFNKKQFILTIHDIEQPPLVNSTSFAKICYLNSLSVLKYEIENDIKFKFSICLRPDLFFCSPDIVADFLLTIFSKTHYAWMITDNDKNNLDDLHFHFPVKKIYNAMGGKMEQDQLAYGPSDIMRFADDYYFRRVVNKDGYVRAHHDLGNHLDEYSIPSNHDIPFRVILTRDYINIPINEQHDFMHDWHTFKRRIK